MLVIAFSILLILGIILGQVVDFSSLKESLHLITSICLAYIMIEVGLEFSGNNVKWRAYRWDAFVAFTAAILPVILWFVYFLVFIQNPWKPVLLASLSCAPTSAGVLFSMLLAAGLSASWVYKKAQTLAVLDDLATILLLTPLQIIIVGFNWSSLAVLMLIVMFIMASFRWQNSLPWPSSRLWLFLYAMLLTGIILGLKQTMHLHLDVLIPAFMWGCLIRHKHQATTSPIDAPLDITLKSIFMLCVGLSFPQLTLGNIPWTTTITHVMALTILSNLGKCFPLLCYRREVPLKQRLALSVAMFPRGEVGAAVLLISLSYGFGGYITSIAMLSLAFNLVLTGLFINVVIRLLNHQQKN